ncbi:MAG: hypothetical protein PHH36_08795 [Sideroxydans sp.]|nr:hypothetical protein [Sideroxydans sp.]
MSISLSSLRAAAVYLGGSGLILAIYGFLFPALNWPDEYRNVMLLQKGEQSGYAFIYGHYARAVMQIADSLFNLNELGDVLGAVQASSGYHMIHGALHYKTVADIPPVYYFAKLANLTLAGTFAAMLVLYLSGSSEASRNRHIRVFLLSLCFPSVAYGVMQISTDILFILCSLLPFFVRDRASSLGLAFAMALLVVEDRSFVLLSAFILLREGYDWLLSRRIARAGWGRRLGWLLLFSVSTMAAAYLVTRLLADPRWLDMLYPGLGDGVALALEYTHDKSYNPLVSLVVFYAGLIILPGATEFFVALLPLYLMLLFAFHRFLRFCLSPRFGEEGARAFIALLAVLTVFFFLTGVVHVFESGRYYLYLVPYVVNALLSGAISFRTAGAPRPEWAILYGCTLVAIAVTLLAYAL